MSESEEPDIRLNNPTLKELLRACEDLCHELRVPYDPYKLRVTTDYGTKVIFEDCPPNSYLRYFETP